MAFIHIAQTSPYKLIKKAPKIFNLSFFPFHLLTSSSFGREDEEVMGLRFCNEAIMSLHQVWPRKEEPTRESLSPLQVSRREIRREKALTTPIQIQFKNMLKQPPTATRNGLLNDLELFLLQ